MEQKCSSRTEQQAGAAQWNQNFKQHRKVALFCTLDVLLELNLFRFSQVRHAVANMNKVFSCQIFDLVRPQPSKPAVFT